MCLIALKTEKVKIATRDITCYKIVGMRDKTNPDTVEFYPAFHTGTGFKYIKGQIATTTIKTCEYSYEVPTFDTQERNDYEESRSINDFDKLIVYTEGFHSASNKKRLCSCKGDDTIQLVKCTIPKGSEYIRNKSKLMISNQLRIEEII